MMDKTGQNPRELPENGFAIYQLKSDPQYHSLRFASLSELCSLERREGNLADAALGVTESRYRESGWSPAFFREHKADIEAHKEAQAVYSAADGKLPTLAELSEEYDILLSQKRQTGEELSRLNEELKNLRHIKSNMDTLLDDERYETDRHDHNELNMPERNRHADENTR